MDEVIQSIKDFLKKNTSPEFDFSGGASGFSDIEKTDKRFGFSFKNTLGTPKTIALLTGVLSAERNVIIEAPGTYKSFRTGFAINVDSLKYPVGSIVKINDDPTIINQKANVTADIVLHDPIGDQAKIYVEDANNYFQITNVDGDSTIDAFKEHLKFNPALISEIQVSSSTSEFGYIYVKNFNPYNKKGFEKIELNDAFLPTNAQDKKVIVKNPALVLGSESVLLFSVPAKSQITITFKVGCYLNGIQYLQGKYKELNTIAQFLKIKQ